MRAPNTMRLKMSRPIASAPSTWAPNGRARIEPLSVLNGSNRVIGSANTAASTNTAMITAPAAPSG